MNEICIIGGGVSGIVTSKISLSKGLTPVIFEKNSNFGGLWQEDPNIITRWESLIVNLCKYTMTLSDHLWPANSPLYPTANQYFDYLTSYVEKHNLTQYFKFGTEVICIEKIHEGYLVTFKDIEGIHERLFKYVIIANGLYSKYKDSIKNREVFQGETIFSGYYRNPSIFTGKNVVVVGTGHSGCELANEASKYAKSITQIHRKKFCKNSRLFNGVPYEFYGFSIQSVLNNQLQLHNTLEMHKNSIRNLLKTFGNPGDFSESLRITEEDLQTSYIANPINFDEYFESIRSGRINCVQGSVKEYYAQGLILSSGQHIEADLVIDATGYASNIDFLGDSIKRIVDYDQTYSKLPVTLFRGCIHPELPGFAFAGRCFSFFIEPISEICLRWVTGTLDISNDELWEGVRLEKELRPESLKNFFVYSPKSFLQEVIKILKVEFDLDLLKELKFSKGLCGLVFLFPNRSGQKEMIRDYIKMVRDEFPSFDLE